MFDKEIYIKRRATLRMKFKSGKLIFLGNDESSKNFKANWYHFKQDTSFLYYFGINQSGLAGIIDIDSGEDILFGNELTIDDIVWTGPLPSLLELASQVGISKVLPMEKLSDHTDKNTRYLPPYRPEHNIKLSALTYIPLNQIENHASIEFINAVVEQRSVKSDIEIQSLHEACTHTSRMHLEVMKACRPGMSEHDLVAVAKAYAYRQNIDMSFTPIMTTRGEVLHNHDYSNVIDKDSMILFDGGMESKDHYAGDMTRTFPAGGTFSTLQADLYDIVLKSQEDAINAIKPGVRFLDIHLLAAKSIVIGLTELGIMKGDPAESVARGAHTMFFQCGLGHMMGMDVHDMENLGEEYVGYTPTLVKSTEFGLKSLRLGRELKEGFVITVEPGIYVIPSLIDKFKTERKFEDFINFDELNKIRSFGGIRIEDDFVVTSNGSQLLGEPLVKKRRQVEDLRSSMLA